MTGNWSGRIVFVTAYPKSTFPMVRSLEATETFAGKILVETVSEKANGICNDLYLADFSDGARLLTEAGLAVAGLEHSENEGTDFSFLDYVVSSPEELDWQDYLHLWNRITRQPCDILETDRLYVRETTVEDVEVFYELYRDPSVTKYMENLFEDPDEERAYQKMYIRNVYGLYGYGVWTVIEKETGRIIGRAGIAPKEGFVEPELGFVIGTRWQGCGYAYEVCNAILSYAAKTLEIPAVIAVVHEDNLASIRLCEKLGLQDTGEMIQKKHRKFFCKMY